jgi:hypothetical protein
LLFSLFYAQELCVVTHDIQIQHENLPHDGKRKKAVVQQTITMPLLLRRLSKAAVSLSLEGDDD